MGDWYIYIVRCRDGTLYTGITTDVTRRLAEHRAAGDAGAKYLKGRGPLALLFKNRLGDRSLALKVERMVKRLSKTKKENLVLMPVSIDEIVKRANQ